MLEMSAEIEYENTSDGKFVLSQNESYNFHSVSPLNPKRNVAAIKTTLKVLAIALTAVVLLALFACLVGAYVQISMMQSEITSHQQMISANNASNQLQASESLAIANLTRAADVASKQISSLISQATFSSCAAVLQLSPTSTSGYFWVRSFFGHAVRVYCDMTRSCGGISGGWMRVAKLDMTKVTTRCPKSLSLNTTDPRTCRINFNESCPSVTFPTKGINYSRVCGRVIAYQVGTTNAFTYNYRIGRRFRNAGIDGNYVDGVSLTHGEFPRQHIWTFAAALNELKGALKSKCPCINSNVNIPRPPAFVGNDYFCDTGFTPNQTHSFFSRDSLWDGAGCGLQNTCCSFNNPPWFFKKLAKTTFDDIEMRVCCDEPRSNEDIAVQKIDIFVQ